MNNTALATISIVYVVVVIVVIMALRLTTVNFADPELEAAIRDAIGKPRGPSSIQT